MAEPNLTGRLLILVGDGADPEMFKFPCGANARSVTFTNNTGEEVLLDCDNPLDGGSWITRWLESQDTQLTISGRVATDSLPMWRGWADAGNKKNIRIEIDETSANGGGHWTLAAILQGFELGREGGGGNGTATFSATIVGSGPREWVDAT